jgi:DNA-binding beta-propeller fold protein YncE
VVDEAYKVGAVPKVVAVTPDGRYVLVSNWCTWDLSVISTKKGREVKRIPKHLASMRGKFLTNTHTRAGASRVRK